MSREERIKTNVTRLLDQKKAAYIPHGIPAKEAVSADRAAELLGLPPAKVFKTLVTVGKTGAHYVFLVPAGRELDLRKAAACVGEKKVDMLPQKELLPLTGYVHGGCSPLGMKRAFPTVLHETAAALDTLVFSAGKIGCHVEISPGELKKVLEYQTADICG